MYELKKMEKYLRVNLLGSGPRVNEKRIYRAAVSQRLRDTDLNDKLILKLNFFFLCYNLTEMT